MATCNFTWLQRWMSEVIVADGGVIFSVRVRALLWECLSKLPLGELFDEPKSFD